MRRDRPARSPLRLRRRSATSMGEPPRARRCTGASRVRAAARAPQRCSIRAVAISNRGAREQRADAFGREPRQRWRVAHLPQRCHARARSRCARRAFVRAAASPRAPPAADRWTLPREGRTGSRTGASASEKRPASANASASFCTMAGGAPRQVRIALQHGHARRRRATEQAHHRIQPRVHVPVRGIDGNTFRENRLCALGPVQPEEPCVPQVAVERPESGAGLPHLLPLLDGLLHHSA